MGLTRRDFLRGLAAGALAAALPPALAAGRTQPKGALLPGRHPLSPEHPRIFADAASFRRVAALCDTGGLLEPSYQAMKRSLVLPMDKTTGYYPRAWTGPLFGFVYQVETALHRDASQYLNHVREAVWGTDGSKMDGLEFAYDGIIYDWIYDGLTPQERILYGNCLGRFLRHYTNVPEITLEGGTYWYNQTWGPGGVSWSRDGIWSKTMLALAIAGEKTDHEEDARRWLASFAKRMPEEFLHKLDQLGGVWPEGPNHGSIIMAPFLAWEAWRVAMGENLFPKVERTGFHREAPYWGIYGTVPHTGQMAHLEDTGPGRFRGLALWQLRAIHASRYRDGITQGMTKSAVASGQASWADALWYDPSIPVVKEDRLPLAFHFRNSGHVYMRSAWQGADDTWAVFTAAPAFTMYGYGSGGTGSFQVAKQGLLAGHAGYDLWSSSCLPNSLNVVLVYDPKEKYFITSGEESGRNDGGPQVPNFYHSLTPVERGKIVAYEHRPEYTYVAADLTRAYSSVRDTPETKQRTGSEKLRDFTRQFLYVRGDQEFFVIYDRVCATDAAFPKTWLVHLQEKPEVLAGDRPPTITKEGPGFTTYEGATGVLSRVVSRDGGRWTTDKRGAGALRTLLPQNAQLTVRGGKGFETWGNPHDPNAADSGIDAERRVDSDIDICLWRVEVEPSQPSAEHHFLHVLVPYADAARGEGAFQPKPDAFRLVQDATHEGVSLETPQGALTVLFNREGAPGGTVTLRPRQGAARTISLAKEVRPNEVPPGLAISPER